MSRAAGILRNFNFLFTKLTKPYFSLDVLTEISYDIFTDTYIYEIYSNGLKPTYYT